MKTPEKIRKFRNFLAEQGMEYTTDQAEFLYNSTQKLIKRSKNISQLDLWKIKNMRIKGMSEKEKQDAIKLYQHIKDM
jgi:hypothetical protein